MDRQVADAKTGGDSAGVNASPHSDGYDDSGKGKNSEEVAAPVSTQIEMEAKAT